MSLFIADLKAAWPWWDRGIGHGHPSEAYGIDTIDALSTIVWRRLAGTRQS
jgi:hypothetical protein